MWRSIFLSFAFQLIAVTVGVIVSILTVDQLGAFSLPRPMPPIPRARAIQVVASQRYASVNTARLHAPARVFVAPTRIPTGVPVILDGPERFVEASPLVQIAEGTVGLGPGGNPLGNLQRPGGPTSPPQPPPSKPEPRPEKQVVRIGGNVLEAKLVRRVMPVYPALAKQMRISGVVRLEGAIARDGRIVNLQVVSGHPMLVAAAVDAVREWIYRPTLLNGEAVEVIAPIDVRFILSQ